MGRFDIAPEIFARFPGLRLAVAVAEGLDNAAPRPGVDALWKEAWRDVAAAVAPYASVQAHPRLAPWRVAFRALGLSPKEYRCSVEAMARRASRGDAPFRINPLVDWYNALSLRHLVPAGGFDLEQFVEPLELRLSRGGERFAALGGATPEDVPPGEVSYLAGETVLTRHFVWRQAAVGALVPTTRRAFFVSEVLGAVEAEGGVAAAILAEFGDGLREHFGVGARLFLLDAATPGCAW